jgi:cellulose synthase/poly-beta-1,6-N-acetylglucosamine synthase-like glycosyltransferase
MEITVETSVVKRSSITLMRKDYQEVSPRVYKRNLMAKRNSVTLSRGDFKNADLKRRIYKKKMALLLPAHNEELIIQVTINSAVKAGQSPYDIYVVDDNSSDATYARAAELLGESHVLTVERSGKAQAVSKAIEHFQLTKRYSWLHVADADSVFGNDYFRIYRRNLKGKKHAAAVGFVQSLRGNWISKYRAFCYTYSQHVIRRTQSWFGLIAVLPGPVTCFRTDIIDKLDFTSESLTEDFDLTLQIHRKKLGGIKFIPGAVNFTQDPQTLSDFCRQTARWQRGFFQCVFNHRIGTRIQKIDASIGYQMLQIIFYLFELFVFAPYIIITTGRWQVLPAIIIGDFVVVAWLAIFSAVAAKRFSILSALPYFYFLRWLELSIFLKSFVEVAILKKFTTQVKGWQTEGRRYALDAAALKDTAQ